MWTLYNGGLTSLPAAFAIAMVVAALIGLVNGWFVTKLKIPSFLVTLGMLLVVRGTALYVPTAFRSARGARAANGWRRRWSASSTSAASASICRYSGPSPPR